MEALTLCSTVVDCALRVGPAGVIADVLALSIYAQTFVRTVLVSIGTAALREASRLVGVSYMSSRTGAGVTGGCGGAACRGVAWCLAACIHWSTSHLRQRIRSSPRWAGTLWTLIFRQAHCIPSTRVGCTYIHTVEGESVTELGRWAVLICQTGNSLAALDGIRGVSFELAWRTCALRRVILGDADSLWTAYDVIAGRNTFPQGLTANLLL